MSTPSMQMRREAVGQSLSETSDASVKPSAAADAAVATWKRVAACLEPVIGSGGVHVLFGRSLHLTSRDFPWLAATGYYGDSSDRFASMAGFRAALESREPSDAAAAVSALMKTFIELLETLIGEPLTERLLGAVLLQPAPSAFHTVT